MPFRSITLKPNQPFTQLISSATDAGNTLIFNSDQVNTVWLTDVIVGNPATVDAGPIPPNGSVVVDGSKDIYAFTLGGTPLVYLYPSGVAAFRGLTQSLGNLAIPSVQSPNFLTGVSGWQIAQDGSAEFNNIKIRGNQVFSDGFISDGDGTFTNTPGLFLYDGTPAAGNLIYSLAAAAGTDKFGNNYVGGGDTSYDNINATALTNQGSTLQFYTMTSFNPGAGFTAAGLINNIGGTSFIDMFPGVVITSATSDPPLVLISDVGSIASLGPDNNGALLNTGVVDGNNYRAGETFFPATGVSIGNGFSVIKTFPIGVGPIYELYVRVLYRGNQNAGAPVIGWHGGLALPACYGYTQYGFVQNAVYVNAVPGDRTGPTLTTADMIYETRLRWAAPSTQSGSVGFAASVSGAGDSMVIDSCDIFMKVIAQ